jgi:hypothetical protein
MPEITEIVYTKDDEGLFRITGITDTDGVFYATLAKWDREEKEWDCDYLTQFQQDTKAVVPIAADPNDEILDWFGIDREAIIDEATFEKEKNMSKYIIEQKYETWYRVEVEAESLDAAVELGLAALSNGDGVENRDGGSWCDDYWAEDVEAEENGFVELDGEKWVIV